MNLEDMDLEGLVRLWDTVEAHDLEVENKYSGNRWRADKEAYAKMCEEGKKLWERFLVLEEEIVRQLLPYPIYFWHKDTFKKMLRTALEEDRLEVLIFDTVASGI